MDILYQSPLFVKCSEVQPFPDTFQMTSFIAALTVVLALAIHLSTAQTPKSKFDSKVKVLGVTFYTITELSKVGCAVA